MARGIGILELQRRIQPFGHQVDFGALHQGQIARADEYRQIVRNLECLIAVGGLVDIVEQVVDTFRPLGRESAVTLRFDDSAEHACARADEDGVIQVVTNLLSNALRFSPRDAQIEISVARHDGAIRVSVADQGDGIPESFRPRVFQKFAQADGSDSRRKGGTGLGLSICQGIIENFGGKIGFETETGEGTVFRFDLPELRDRVDGAARSSNSGENP